MVAWCKAGFVVEKLWACTVSHIAARRNVVFDQAWESHLLFATVRKHDVVGVLIFAALVHAVDYWKLSVQHIVKDAFMGLARF